MIEGAENKAIAPPDSTAIVRKRKQEEREAAAAARVPAPRPERKYIGVGTCRCGIHGRIYKNETGVGRAFLYEGCRCRPTVETKRR